MKTTIPTINPTATWVPFPFAWPDSGIAEVAPVELDEIEVGISYSVFMTAEPEIVAEEGEGSDCDRISEDPVVNCRVDGFTSRLVCVAAGGCAVGVFEGEGFCGGGFPC